MSATLKTIAQNKCYLKFNKEHTKKPNNFFKTMANKPNKALSPEKVQENAIRAFLQKKAALAEGILYNMIQGLGFIPDADNVDEIVGICDEMATKFMKVVYNQSLTPKEQTEE